MINVRHAEDRGSVNLGWLESKHTFSFGHFFDADYTNFGPLRVINEDRV
jgi:redox-sensitive bicupin YhaK (pirin superfamily)